MPQPMPALAPAVGAAPLPCSIGDADYPSSSPAGYGGRRTPGAFLSDRVTTPPNDVVDLPRAHDRSTALVDAYAGIRRTLTERQR